MKRSSISDIKQTIRQFRLCFTGEVLHLVDFDQLKIENQQYMERIDGKNKELLQLKLSTSRAVQVRRGGGLVAFTAGGGTGDVEGKYRRRGGRGEAGKLVLSSSVPAGQCS